MLIEKFKNLTKNKTILKGALFSLYSFINKGISFLLLLVLANYIEPKEYGQLGLYTTFTMFLSYFIALSTPGYLSFSYFQKKKEEFKIDISVIISITIVSFLLIILIFLCFKKDISNFLELPKEIALIGIISSFFAVFYQIHLNLHRIQENLRQYGLISCGYALFNAILALYFVVYLCTNWKGKIYAEIFSYSIFFCFSIIYLVKHKLLTTHIKDFKRYKEILMWSLPLIPHLATTWIKQGCDRYIIESSLSMEEVGLFSFALNLANIITMIGVAFNASNSVDIYKSLSNGTTFNIIQKQRYDILKIYILISTTIIIIGLLFIPLLFPLYKLSVGYFIILSISMFLQCTYFLFSNYIFYFKKTKKLMYITFGTSIIHLLLSLCFTRYSLYFTCLIYVISQLIMVVLVAKLANKSIKESIYEN